MGLFSYDETQASTRDRVRFYIRDTAEDAGPLPGDANFSDDELDATITAEGSWQRAVAACFEALASAWIRHPSQSADGLSLSRSDIARGYQEQAKSWRDKYGYPNRTVASAALVRADGYSDDIDAWET